MNYLIINADDFGLCESVNDAIIELFLDKKISSCTFMINLQGVDHALKNLENRDLKNMPIGLHFNIVRGKSILGKSSITDYDGYFLGRKMLFKKIFLNQVKLSDVNLEFEAQINFLLDKNFKISHIDSDNHTLSNPIIYSTLKNNIIDNRLPCRSLKPLKYVNFLKKPKRFFQQMYLYLSDIKNNSKDVKSNDYLSSIYDSNNNNIEKITYQEILKNKKNNQIIELMVHPYKSSKDLYKIYSKPNEQQFLNNSLKEYQILKQFNVCDSAGFKLTDYLYLKNS